MTNRVRSCRCCSVKCDDGRESRGSKQSQRRHETENFIKSGQQQQLLLAGRSSGDGAVVGGKQQVLAWTGEEDRAKGEGAW